jgi:hypothetical protein
MVKICGNFGHITMRVYVTQNAQKEVSYVFCCDAKKDLTRKLVIIFPIYLLTSLNVSGHVI